MRILGVCGSLGIASSNAAVLAMVRDSVQPPDEMVVFDTLDDLPHFSPDRDGDPVPSSVVRWRAAVATADAVIVATPEYAGGMPGVLKNALDWLVGSGELYGRPAVVLSAAPSAERGGGARRSVELTLRMQGADVRDSFTVAAAGGESHATDAVTRALGALTTPAFGHSGPL